MGKKDAHIETSHVQCLKMDWQSNSAVWSSQQVAMVLNKSTEIACNKYPCVIKRALRKSILTDVNFEIISPHIFLQYKFEYDMWNEYPFTYLLIVIIQLKR